MSNAEYRVTEHDLKEIIRKSGNDAAVKLAKEVARRLDQKIKMLRECVNQGEKLTHIEIIEIFEREKEQICDDARQAYPSLDCYSYVKKYLNKNSVI